MGYVKQSEFNAGVREVLDFMEAASKRLDKTKAATALEILRRFSQSSARRKS